MPFRTINASPEDLAVLCRAFDAAWVEINSIRPVEATAQSAARERLGHIIVSLWQGGEESPALAPTAVARFLEDDHTVRIARKIPGVTPA